MSYAQNGTIQASDYNNLAWGGTQGTYTSSTKNIAYVMGVGSGGYGYGQDLSLINTVSSTNTVTAAQWAGLVYLLNRALGHQGGSTAQIASGGNVNMTAGETITYFANVAQAVTDINTNYTTFNSTRGTTTTGSNLDGLWNTSAPTTFQQVRTVTFDDADKMRYFFNAGGRINLALTTVSGTDVTKETSWTNMLNNGFGTLSLDYTTCAISGSGYTVSIDGRSLGFWDITTSDQTLIRLTDTTAAYNTNYVEVLFKVSGAAGSNGGKGTVITFTINYNDQAADTTYDAPQGGAAADTISMYLRTRIDIIRPETTYLTDVWGTISVAATVN